MIELNNQADFFFFNKEKGFFYDLFIFHFNISIFDFILDFLSYF